MRKLGVVTVVVMLLFASGWWWKIQSTPQVPAYLQQIGGDFTVQSVNGPVRLSDFRGEIVLLYFGYSHCPDVCPATLSVMAAAMRLLDADEQQQVQGLFVSVDPRRDSPSVLKKYTAFFSPKILGATAKREELDKIAHQWHFSYSVPEQPKDAFYTVQHPNFLFVLNQDGQVVALLDEKSTPEEVKKVIQRWL